MGTRNVQTTIMKRKKNTRPQRIDAEFERDMKDIAKIRLNKGLAKLNSRDLSISEMTRLLRRTNSYPNLLEELRNKPKRENLK